MAQLEISSCLLGHAGQKNKCMNLGNKAKIAWIDIIIISAVLPAAGMFVLPAALLWVQGGFRTRDRFTRAIYCIFFGVSCWTWLPWLTRYIPVSLSSLIWAVVLALAGLLVVLAVRGKGLTASPPMCLGRGACLLLAIVTATILLARLVPAALLYAPPGADMSMHAYNARLIIDSDSIPRTHRPLLPIDSFGEYPIGFAVLVACTSLMKGAELLSSAILWTGLTYVLLTLGLFLFLRVWLSPGVSLVTAAVATCLAAAPQNYFDWGGNPTVLSFAFILAALSLFFSLKDEHRFLSLFVQASFWAAALLIHSIPFLGAAYFLLAFGLCFSARAVVLKRAADLKTYTARCALVIATALALVAPFLAGYSANVSDNEIGWVKRWQTEADHVWHGTIHNCLWVIPPYVVHVSGRHIIGFAMLGLFLSTLSWRVRFSAVFASLVLLALTLNSQYWLLPFSYALYPERMTAMLLAPMALLVGGLIDKMHRFGSRASSALKSHSPTSLGQQVSKTLPAVCTALAAAAVVLRLVSNLLASNSGGFRSLRVGLFVGLFVILLFDLWAFRQERKLASAACGLSIVLVLLCLLVGYSCINLYEHYIGPMVADSSVRQDDLNAFEWIKRNTLKTDIILNVPECDCGSLWIPALCDRRILRPHSNPFYFDELRRGNEGATPTYLFIGSGPHRDGRLDPAAEAVCSLPEWQKVVSFGRAEIYQRRVLGPGSPAPTLIGPGAGP